MNTAMPILRRALVYGAWLALAIAVIGGTVGWFVAGGSGVLSALVGTAMAAVFLGITSGSILLANRSSKSDMFSPVFFIIVMGGWLLKFVLFLVIIFVLRDQQWIQPVVLFLSIVAGVVGSLAVDVIVVATSRQPYVDVTLPGDAERHATTD
jgi:hypothetical protein